MRKEGCGSWHQEGLAAVEEIELLEEARGVYAGYEMRA